MFLSLAKWIEATDFFSNLRGSYHVYPIILALHLVFISLFGAMIVMTDMRLLGWAMSETSVSDVVDQLRIPKRVGFVLTATCGLLLLGSKAEEYYYNYWFRTKLTLFALVAVHALVFRRTVYGKTAEFDRAKTVPGRAKLAACLSLLLWASIVCAGRGIGYLKVHLDT